MRHLCATSPRRRLLAGLRGDFVVLRCAGVCGAADVVRVWRGLQEELEEAPGGGVYEDYKFVTRAELATLGLGHLVGSNLLRAYMHGFFLDHRLYNKVSAAGKRGRGRLNTFLQKPFSIITLLLRSGSLPAGVIVSGGILIAS